MGMDEYIDVYYHSRDGLYNNNMSSGFISDVS